MMSDIVTCGCAKCNGLYILWTAHRQIHRCVICGSRNFPDLVTMPTLLPDWAKQYKQFDMPQTIISKTYLSHNTSEIQPYRIDPLENERRFFTTDFGENYEIT